VRCDVADETDVEEFTRLFAVGHRHAARADQAAVLAGQADSLAAVVIDQHDDVLLHFAGDGEGQRALAGLLHDHEPERALLAVVQEAYLGGDELLPVGPVALATFFGRFAVSVLKAERRASAQSVAAASAAVMAG